MPETIPPVMSDAQVRNTWPGDTGATCEQHDGPYRVECVRPSSFVNRDFLNLMYEQGWHYKETLCVDPDTGGVFVLFVDADRANKEGVDAQIKAQLYGEKMLAAMKAGEIAVPGLIFDPSKLKT